jgi:hypothetical protein
VILTGLIPDQVARITGVPYVARSRLRFSKARADVVDQLVKLNPRVTVERQD